jgi:phenylacetate-coenzyme A ligase PaaK-like adenylate-forming protein
MLEFNDFAELQGAREAAFARTMDLAFERHPYFRDQCSALGLKRADLGSLRDLARLPITTKAQYMAAPERFVLETTGLPLEMRTVWDTMYTTGSTSGQPTPFVSTSYDFYSILALQRNMLRLRGVTPDDLIANLFPLTPAPHGAWTRVLHAAASLGVPVVSLLPGNPSPYFEMGRALDQVVDELVRQQPTVLWGVPSYVHRVLGRVLERGLELERVRLVFVTGEALAETGRAQMIDQLRRAGAQHASISISYGSTEMQGGMVECRPGSGFHNPLPARILIDIVDPVSHRVLEDGELGLVTLSHLDRYGTVLLRYALGDLSIRTRERCPHCGAITDRLIRTPSRHDELVKVKGMLINPSALVSALDDRLGARPYQLRVLPVDPERPLAGDRLVLVCSGGPGAAASEGKALTDLIKQSCGVTPEVLQVDAAELQAAQASWKAKKFVDMR